MLLLGALGVIVLAAVSFPLAVGENLYPLVQVQVVQPPNFPITVEARQVVTSLGQAAEIAALLG
jgi:hypothetical protein